MGKQRGKTEAVRQRRARIQRRRFLIAGITSVALLAGFTWYFYPRPSPLSAAARYQGGPRLAVDTDLIDFGPVRFDKVVQARFLLRNVGDQPLQVSANPSVDVVEGC